MILNLYQILLKNILFMGTGTFWLKISNEAEIYEIQVLQTQTKLSQNCFKYRLSTIIS